VDDLGKKKFKVGPKYCRSGERGKEGFKKSEPGAKGKSEKKNRLFYPKRLFPPGGYKGEARHRPNIPRPITKKRQGTGANVQNTEKSEKTPQSPHKINGAVCICVFEPIADGKKRPTTRETMAQGGSTRGQFHTQGRGITGENSSCRAARGKKTNKEKQKKERFAQPH